MCTYVTTTVDVRGSGKSPVGWIPVTQASVYVDHPFHAQFEHTVNIDVVNPSLGPAARIALELTEEGARALVDAIQAALAAAPPGLASEDQ